MKHLYLILFLLCSNLIYAQNSYVHKLFQSNNIKVYNRNNELLQFPFGGGLAFPVFSHIDLNRDGLMDLVAIDRIDNRILTFINGDKGDSFIFKYTPDFEHIIPDSLSNFINFTDYNHDGLKDLFTYSGSLGAGIAVYKNVGNDIRDSFVMELAQMETYYGENFDWKVNLPMYNVDIPAIVDFDGDGDYDIMTFDPLGGSYLHQFKNCSHDIYGHSDSFIMSNIDEYWGYFIETDSSFYTKLNFKPPDWLGAYKNPYQTCSMPHGISSHFRTRGNGTRHAGSTVYAIDIDNDHDLDLLVGDVQYSKISFLENGKSDHNAWADTIIQHHLSFPEGTKPINIRQMPAVFMQDLNNDGLKDMIAAPISMIESDSFDGLNQVWLYKNTGTASKPKYEFIQENFLQDQMLDLGGPTQPVLHDFDQDGDLDLFIATRGNQSETLYKKDRIVVYENTGSATNPVFRFYQNDYLNLSKQHIENLSLSFGDLNGDGKDDLILGNKAGDLIVYKNIKTSTIDTFSFSKSFKALIPFGYASPALWDFDKDAKADLICGSEAGNLYAFKNISSGNDIDFTMIDDSFGGIVFPGHNHFLAPAVGYVNSDSLPDLVLGSVSWVSEQGYYEGRIKMFKNISLDSNKTFAKFRDPFYYSNDTTFHVAQSAGMHLKPAIANLNADQLSDLMLGNDRGGIMFYSSMPDVINSIEEEKRIESNFGVYPNPSGSFINLIFNESKGKTYNLEIINLTGQRVKNFENVKPNEPVNLNDITSGVYILMLKQKDSSTTFKKVFIKI